MNKLKKNKFHKPQHRMTVKNEMKLKKGKQNEAMKKERKGRRKTGTKNTLEEKEKEGRMNEGKRRNLLEKSIRWPDVSLSDELFCSGFPHSYRASGYTMNLPYGRN